MADKLIRPVALLALTLGFPAVAFGDAFAGDHCPHHDPLPAEHAGPGHAGDAGHTGHTGHRSEIDAGRPDGHGHDHGGPCNCIGQCVMQVGAALPSAAHRSATAAVPAAPARVIEAAAQWTPIAPPYLHPYANAPPPSPR